MIQAVRGTKDILPDTIDTWYFLEETARIISELYGYRELRTPSFEKTEVFSRGVGEGTDIVNKEMYTFLDKGGESITLRPEMTASLVRAVIQSGTYQQNSVSKYWYFAPFYRYERPQKGRLRQFHQFGAECISSPYPESDVEIIQLTHSFIQALGIEEYKLMLNSLGNSNSRDVYRNALIEFLKDNKENLTEDSRNRLEINPLRVLDSKAENDIAIVKNAPIILDYLDNESKDHFEKVKSLLDSLGIGYEITPKLVRGLDYYCHTVFEFQSSALGAQDSFGGGGRYNTLFSQLGGKETPAVGFAMGVERLILILESLNKLPKTEAEADVFVVSLNLDFQAYAANIAQILRAKGLKTATDLQRRSMKAQMREANKCGAKYAVIIGDSEFENKQITIKNLSESSQETIGIEFIPEYDFKF